MGAQAGYEYSSRHLNVVRLCRTLRSGLPDGHGVHQPRRHYQRVGLRRVQLLSAEDQAVVAEDCPVLVYPGRARRECRRQRAAPGDGRARAVQPPGQLQVRSVRRLRGLGRTTLRPRSMADVRRRAALSLVEHRRTVFLWRRGVLRPGRSLSGHQLRRLHRRHPAAERTAVTGLQLPAGLVRSCVDRRARL